MQKKRVILYTDGVNKLFSNYNGQELRIESDKPSSGWIQLSIGKNIRYSLNLVKKVVNKEVPAILLESNLPSASDVMREVVLLISQLKAIEVPVSYIEFIVGKPGITYLCKEETGKYYICVKEN